MRYPDQVKLRPLNRFKATISRNIAVSSHKDSHTYGLGCQLRSLLTCLMQQWVRIQLVVRLGLEMVPAADF